jgi:hypothetical protein
MKLIIRCGLLGYLAALVCACVVAFVTGSTQTNDGFTSPAWIHIVVSAFTLTPIGLVGGLALGVILLLVSKKSARRQVETVDKSVESTQG